MEGNTMKFSINVGMDVDITTEEVKELLTIVKSTTPEVTEETTKAVSEEATEDTAEATEEATTEEVTEETAEATEEATKDDWEDHDIIRNCLVTLFKTAADAAKSKEINKKWRECAETDWC